MSIAGVQGHLDRNVPRSTATARTLRLGSLARQVIRLGSVGQASVIAINSDTARTSVTDTANSGFNPILFEGQDQAGAHPSGRKPVHAPAAFILLI